MSRLIDVTGQRFGRLVAVKRVQTPNRSTKAHWLCICDCGGQTVTSGQNLRRGQTTSCGCAIGAANRARLTTHGSSTGRDRQGHELYQTWVNMRRRCLSPSNHAFPRYGGRGISIAPEWDDFDRFVADVGPRPSLGHSLDRVDNDGNYEPGNVRWATAAEQANNRRTSRRGAA